MSVEIRIFAPRVFLKLFVKRLSCMDESGLTEHGNIFFALTLSAFGRQ